MLCQAWANFLRQEEATAFLDDVIERSGYRAGVRREDFCDACGHPESDHDPADDVCRRCEIEGDVCEEVGDDELDLD